MIRRYAKDYFVKSELDPIRDVMTFFQYLNSRDYLVEILHRRHGIALKDAVVDGGQRANVIQRAALCGRIQRCVAEESRAGDSQWLSAGMQHSATTRVTGVALEARVEDRQPPVGIDRAA